MKFYDLPDVLQEEIKEFDQNIGKYQKGELDPVAFKGIRVSHGIYEQRKPKTHMVRIRCASGGITPKQLFKVSQLAQKYGSGEIHVTTRQEMQIHYVDLENVITVYNELTSVGLSSRGGGGNTVRNILASYDTGVSPEEIFDVAPYAIELTSRMIDEADSWNLPRKFKIAFSNNHKDTARATVTCLGFIAKISNGQRGFKVYCAGGQGSKPMIGQILFDFIEDDKVYFITKAIKIMFDKYGNRRQRSKAKLKFLWDKLGKEKFMELFFNEYNILITDPSHALKIIPVENKSVVDKNYRVVPMADRDRTSFDIWKKRYVRAQKQKGSFMIKIPLRLGDIDGKDGQKIAEEITPFGENVLRFSVKQNLHLRNIPQEYLSNIYYLIRSIHSLSEGPALFGEMIACTGADTCKLGICLPRGVTPQIQDVLLESDLDLDALSDVKIHISGCPNTCGCHHVADLGFFGRILRKEKNMMPGYNILAGAILSDKGTRFSTKVSEISAKDLPFFVRDFLSIYLTKKDRYSSFSDYIDEEGKDDIKTVSDKFQDLPTLQENKNYYYDWGSDEIFTLLKGQKAECSAGMFDMITVDIKMIKEASVAYDSSETDKDKLKHLYAISFSTSRMLLVTRGIESKDDASVFESFIQHFIKTHLIDSKFTDIVLFAKNKDGENLLSHSDDILLLADEVKKLYKQMDDSLRFLDKEGKILGEKVESSELVNDSDKKEETSHRFKDLRGVGCPLNFVKVKIELSSMQSGDKMTVLLDDGEPIENVPGSVKNEGHSVLSSEKQGEHWMLLIQKS